LSVSITADTEDSRSVVHLAIIIQIISDEKYQDVARVTGSLK